MADGRFEFDASAYDAVYPSIHDWAHAKKIEDTHSQEVVEPPREYQSSAKQPTIPFTPLTREIGISPVDDTETREMTRSYQQQISNWVGLVRQPFDKIQRAEGLENPKDVYYASQNRVARNNLDSDGKRIFNPIVGRAAVRRQYDTTYEHLLTAQDRTKKASSYLKRLKDGGQLEVDEKSVIIEILQELANGIGANLDNKLPGGDLDARIAGNSILTLMAGIENGTVQIKGNTIVVYAAVAYVNKQAKLWKMKMSQIDGFAQSMGFMIGRPKSMDADQVA